MTCSYPACLEDGLCYPQVTMNILKEGSADEVEEGEDECGEAEIRRVKGKNAGCVIKGEKKGEEGRRLGSRKRENRGKERT